MTEHPSMQDYKDLELLVFVMSQLEESGTINQHELWLARRKELIDEDENAAPSTFYDNLKKLKARKWIEVEQVSRKNNVIGISNESEINVKGFIRGRQEYYNKLEQKLNNISVFRPNIGRGD